MRVATRMPFIRLVWAAIRASLVAGIVSGLLARLAMSILADAGGSSMSAITGRLTLEGTVRVLIVPMFFGIPFAVGLLAVGRLWDRRHVAIRTVAYAIAALIFPGLLLLSDSEFHLAGPNSTLGPLLFAPSVLAYGALVGLIGDWLLEREARASRTDVTGSSGG